MGQPNLFVSFTFDPFSWLMLLPLEPADAFRLSMALRATVGWAASYWFVVVLFRGRRDIALAAATLYLLINFILMNAWGIHTFAGMYNATHAALFPLLPALALIIMRSRRWLGPADLGLFVALLFFLLDYPIGSLIGTAVFLVYAAAALALARPAERGSAKWGFVKIAAMVVILLLAPPFEMLASWSALIQDSARIVFADELYAYGNSHQPPLMWIGTSWALRLCIVVCLSVLLFSRRWPRPLRLAAVVLVLVVGGVQLAALVKYLELDSGLVDRLPRLHYFEFYITPCYAACGGFALWHWRDLVYPRLGSWAQALSAAVRTVLLLAMTLFILPVAAIFVASYGLIVAAAFVRGERKDAGEAGTARMRRLVSGAALGGLVVLAIASWFPPSADIYPIFYAYARCHSGVFWCRDAVGPTVGAGRNPITQFLRRELGSSGEFAGRAETLVRPPARMSLAPAGAVRWTPALFALLHSWYERAYDAQVFKDRSLGNPLRLRPDQVVWYGPGDSRDYLLAAIVSLAHSDAPFIGPMQEDLVIAMHDWLSENGRRVGLAASDVTDGWETTNSIAALVDERTNAFFMTGNGLLQRALPFQEVPVASSYDQGLGYLYYLLWTRYVSAGEAARKSINLTSLETLLPDRLALLGVRYVVARDSEVYEPPPLARVMGWHGYSVYAVPDANLAGYAVREAAYGRTLTDELRLMRRHGFMPWQTAVLPADARAAPAEGALSGVARATLRLGADEVVFKAASAGARSLVVLPVNWSHCWGVEWRQGAGQVLRADVGLVGVAFSGAVELRLRWRGGYGSARDCLGEDAALVSEARAAAAAIGFAEAYEPIDTETPPFAVEHPSFAHHDDLVSEREITRRGDIEAEVPAYAAKLLLQEGTGGRQVVGKGRDHVPPTGRRLRVLRRECRRCRVSWSCRSPTPIAGRRIGRAPRARSFPWTGGGSACCSAITRRRMSPCHPTALRRNARKRIASGERSSSFSIGFPEGPWARAIRSATKSTSATAAVPSNI